MARGSGRRVSVIHLRPGFQVTVAPCEIFEQPAKNELASCGPSVDDVAEPFGEHGALQRLQSANSLDALAKETNRSSRWAPRLLCGDAENPEQNGEAGIIAQHA